MLEDLKTKPLHLCLCDKAIKHGFFLEKPFMERYTFPGELQVGHENTRRLIFRILGLFFRFFF